VLLVVADLEEKWQRRVVLLVVAHLEAHLVAHLEEDIEKVWKSTSLPINSPNAYLAVPDKRMRTIFVPFLSSIL
jgi:hypothetical protein